VGKKAGEKIGRWGKKQVRRWEGGEKSRCEGEKVGKQQD